MSKKESLSFTGAMVENNNTMIYLKLSFLILFLPFVLEANPFDKYDKDLDDWKSSHSQSGYSARSEMGKIAKLFSTGDFSPNEETEIIDPMSDLPKYLKFSTIVSSKIVSEKGIVVKKHTVKKSDTLSSLARNYNTTVANIKNKNGLKTDIIRLGDILEIPVVTGNASRKKIVTQRIFINPVPESRISSSFGRRKDPFNKFSRNFHSGLDLAAPLGTPIVAAADGEVVFTGKNGGYGNTVILLHENGYKTVYAHCAKIVVNVGEKVKMGRVIGAVGRTGTATGAHLHFEVHKNGKLQNPAQALQTYKSIITNLPTKVAGI